MLHISGRCREGGSRSRPRCWCCICRPGRNGSDAEEGCTYRPEHFPSWIWVWRIRIQSLSNNAVIFIWLCSRSHLPVLLSAWKDGVQLFDNEGKINVRPRDLTYLYQDSTIPAFGQRRFRRRIWILIAIKISNWFISARLRLYHALTRELRNWENDYDERIPGNPNSPQSFSVQFGHPQASSMSAYYGFDMMPIKFQILIYGL